MEWTNNKPTRAGYYWYLGPVLARDFKRIKDGADIRLCTWGPIIAGVGICMVEIPVNDGKPAHEKMWADGRIVVEFYGSTVRRTLKEMPDGVMWAGPIIPPFNDAAMRLQPEGFHTTTPWSCETNAAEITAWSVAARNSDRG